MTARLMEQHRVRVRRERCETCIFHPGNRMDLRPGRVAGMVRDCIERQTIIPCHDYLERERGSWVAGPRANGYICRGFYDTQGERIWLLVLAEYLNLIEEGA